MFNSAPNIDFLNKKIKKNIRRKSSTKPFFSVLNILFVANIIMCSVFFVFIFLNLVFTNDRITRILSELNQNLKMLQTPNPNIFSIEAKAFIDRLEFLSNRAIDTNITTFFIEFFATSLITAGVYLLNRSHEKVKEVHHKAKRIENIYLEANKIALIKSEDAKLATNRVNEILDKVRKYLELQNVSWSTTNYFIYSLSLVFNLSQLIIFDTNEKITTRNIVIIRDLLTLLKRKLDEAINNGIGIEESQYTILLDLIHSTLNNLKSLSQPRYDELITICEQCRDLLCNPIFTYNYIAYSSYINNIMSFTKQNEH